jgi:ATP-dependent DNA ligase
MRIGTESRVDLRSRGTRRCMLRRVATHHAMPLNRRREPFDDDGWAFEPKYDGFRALAFVDRAPFI